MIATRVADATERPLVRALRLTLEAGLVGVVGVVVVAVVLARGAGFLGATTLVVAGPSMEPTVGQGAAIIVAPVEPGELRVGDVVSLRVGPEQAVVTHRISRLVALEDGLWLETKGDANAAPDPSLVPASAVIGRVGPVIPFVGYLIAALALPSGLATAAGACGVLLALMYLLETLAPSSIDRGRRRPAPSNGLESAAGSKA